MALLTNLLPFWGYSPFFCPFGVGISYVATVVFFSGFFFFYNKKQDCTEYRIKSKKFQHLK